MLKTLAAKHSSTVSTMAAKYKATIATPYGPRICFQVIVPCQRQDSRWSPASAGSPSGNAEGRYPRPPPRPATGPNELIHQAPREPVRALRALRELQVHHIRKLADLDKFSGGRPA